MKYYSIKITVITKTDSGKEKKHSEEYLTQAVSVTDAEANIIDYFKNHSNFDYYVSSVRETKIVDNIIPV